jgi:hypothetical protein
VIETDFTKKPCQALKRDDATAEFDTDVTMCNSACVYALAGASARLVPPGARLGIHAGEIVPLISVQPGLLEGAKRAADTWVEEYLQEMGIDRALFAAANAVPHQTVRFLQRDEIIRFRLDTREIWRYELAFRNEAGPRHIEELFCADPGSAASLSRRLPPVELR